MATLGEEVGLRQVREDELDALKQRLARHLPHSLAVYGAASLAARYGLHSLRPASILVPTCPRPSCLTVMASITSSAMQCLVVFWSLEEHTVKDVTDRLSRLPHLDWNQRVIMFSVPTVLLPSLQSLKQLGTPTSDASSPYIEHLYSSRHRRFSMPLQSLSSWGHRRVTLQAPYIEHLYQLKTPTILNAKLPQMYNVTRLRKEDASAVWTNWEFNTFYSMESVRNDIIYFPSVGIRERGPEDGAGSLQEAEEILVSWVCTSKFGRMGSTFTLPQHRHQGLAGAATMALASQLLQEGLPVFVVIEDSNTASVQLHEKLGFERQIAAVDVELLFTKAAIQDYLE
ncbi:Glycine N-acyltransferase-like protein 3 [Chionoecetes opilio]|uniref:Glycine N-acyltransferase-like protein 3 n=1 Tax=Chionoecetes opilio TaxID=41210 RepID=A0A8J4YMR9_CHIOP|nr:Glycine N-acyltransferase-like protein 3 [Chionoecetes opilio]